MNDKQKLALKELADVMEKHNITIESSCTIYLWAQFGGEVLTCDGDSLNHKYVKKVLLDDE